MCGCSVLLGTVLVEGGLRLGYPDMPSLAGLVGSDFRLEQLVASSGGGGEELCHEVGSFLVHRTRWGPQGGGALDEPPPPPRGHRPGPSGPRSRDGEPNPPSPPGPMLPPPGDLPQGGAEMEHVEFATVTPGAAPLPDRVFGEGAAGPERELWVAGDSLAYGLGVGEEESFAPLLADKIASEAGGPVVLRNLSVPGAGYCTALRRVANTVDAATPDLVLVALSADDLEERSMLLIDGRLVAPPELASNAVVRWLASHSYFANLFWFRVASLQTLATAQTTRFVGEETQANFGQAVRTLVDEVEAVGGTPVVALVEPPGLAHCEEPLVDRCRWLTDDLQLMAEVLDAAGVPYVDLRGRWTGHVEDIVDTERQVVAEGGIAMHPSPSGHAKLATWLWPGVSDAL